jgi:hypothetical protein
MRTQTSMSPVGLKLTIPEFERAQTDSCFGPSSHCDRHRKFTANIKFLRVCLWRQYKVRSLFRCLIKFILRRSNMPSDVWTVRCPRAVQSAVSISSVSCRRNAVCNSVLQCISGNAFLGDKLNPCYALYHTLTASIKLTNDNHTVHPHFGITVRKFLKCIRGLGVI